MEDSRNTNGKSKEYYKANKTQTKNNKTQTKANTNQTNKPNQTKLNNKNDNGRLL
jgi:hypothetical protein